MRKKIDFVEVLMWLAGILIVVLLGWCCYSGINSYLELVPNSFYPKKIDSKEIILFMVFIISIFLLSAIAIISLVNNKIKERRIRLIQKKHVDTEFNALKSICDRFFCETKDKLKIEKVKYVIKNIISASIFIFLALSLTLPFFFSEEPWLYDNTNLAILAFAGIAVSLAMFGVNKEIYNNKVKNNLIYKFIEFVNPKMKYYKNIHEYIMKTSYKEDKQKEIEAAYSEFKINNTNLLFMPSEGIEIYDYIEGFNNEDIYMQIMNAQFYIRGRLGRSYIFKGNLVIIDKNVNSHIKIISNKVNDLDSESLNNNYEFEEYFNADSPISTNLKNFLLDFRNKYKLEFDIVLNDKIYVRFYTKNMFEAKLFGKTIDETSIYQYYAITKFAEEIVNILNN